MSPCLLLDLGNSRGKWLFLNEGVVEREGAAVIDDLSADLAFLPPRTQVLIASVVAADREAALAASLERAGSGVWFARSLATLDGLVNGYSAPAALGVDRWLAMLGAWQRERGRDLCVIDAGSALTIDFVGHDGLHAGGYIVPGSDLMQRSLLSDTGRVRFEETEPVAEAGPGRSTAAAVRNGVCLAQIGAVRCAIDGGISGAATAEAGRALLLCGGGAQILASAIGRPCTVVRWLVFEGLLRQACLEGLAVPDELACAVS